MNIGKSYQIFFAFPFDAATKPMYERIMNSLTKKFKGQFQFIFGNSSIIESSPKFQKIHFFKKQNNDLLQQFLSNIKASDIIVADLTNNNPNVHVELGIGITLNKNILRVSSRNITEVGSDVKGYEVNHYTSEEDLFRKIRDYMERFLSIKELPLSRKAGPLYVKHIYASKPEIMQHEEGQPLPVRPLSPMMRDGALRVKFIFKSAKTDTDWFGIYLRYGLHPWAGPAYLVFARLNGSLELAELPHIRILKTIKYSAISRNDSQILEVAFDGSNLSACLVNQSNKRLEVDNLLIQSPGNVGLGCYRSAVKISSAETTCRDAIEWPI